MAAPDTDRDRLTDDVARHLAEVMWRAIERVMRPVDSRVEERDGGC